MPCTDLPQNLVKRGQTRLFTEETTPSKLTSVHTTKQGVWGKLIVLDGALDYVVPGPPAYLQRIDPGTFAVIEPAVPHHVRLLGPVSFRVEFYRAQSDPVQQ
jgi:tellurite resistance-related uncharacterized protein